jgi:two-component system CheB/CheR fusion protein
MSCTMKKSSKFPIVGIGASAGGIEAMEGFFRGMPEAPGVGFVVVTHLKPDRQSYLGEVIQRFTALPVLTAVAGATVERDHVYVMPAGSVLLIEQGNLQFAPATDQRERKPIDVFFSALAVDQGDIRPVWCCPAAMAMARWG